VILTVLLVAMVVGTIVWAAVVIRRDR